MRRPRQRVEAGDTRNGGNKLPRSIRLRGATWISLAISFSWLGCAEDGTGPGRNGNRAPVALGEIPPVFTDLRYLPFPDVAVWPYFSDPDGDSLTFTATTDDPEVLSVRVADGFVGVRASRHVGTVTVTATDPGGLTARQTFESRQVWPVAPPSPPYPIPPRATKPIPSLQVLRGQSAHVDLTHHFTDEPGLRFEATSSSPATVAASVSSHTLAIDGVDLGWGLVEAIAATRGGSTAQEFKVVVDPPTARLNSAPVFQGGYRKVLPQGITFVLDVSQYLSDPEGDALTYTAARGGPIVAPSVAVPRGGIVLSIASASRIEVTGTATGFTRIRMTAIDPGGLPASGELMVEVTPPVRR